MDTTLIIAIVVVAIGIAAFLLTRKKPELPPPAEPPTKQIEAPAAARRQQPGTGAPAPTAKSEPEIEVEPEPAPPPAPAPAPKAKPTAPAADEVATLKKGLASTRSGFIARLAKVFSGKKEIDPALLDEVEEVLITADIGVKTSTKILDSLRERMSRKELSDGDTVWSAIRQEAEAILGDSGGGITPTKKPTVILVVGVNGVGKTTTIGKLASRYAAEGKKVLLAAGDTFRAAAVLQLEVWAKRVECELVKGKENADPGSVIFDAVKKAVDEEFDVVIADTAGRLHTAAPLMDELQKVGRTLEKALGRPADEVLLVLDSTNGQNAIQQAQLFGEALPVNGIALTKLDGTAKGGVILGIVDQHGLPVRYIGIGEKVEDLREFEPRSFVQALFDKPPEGTAAA